MVKKNGSITLTNEPVDGASGKEMVVGFTNKSYDKQGDGMSPDVSIKGFKKVVNEKEDLEQATEGITVKRTVGLFGGISLIIGTMIGSGIFASAATVSKFSGSVGMSFVVWAGSGMLAICGGLCYVELGLMLPESGGEYIYIKEALGDMCAFLFVYVSNIVLKPASLSAICVAAGDYIVEPFLVYEHVAENQTLIVKLVAFFFLTVLIIINCSSASLANQVQVVFTICKLAALAMIILTGIVRLGQGYTTNFSEPFKGTSTHISDIGYAFYGGLWAYDGWNNLNYAVEELNNPLRNLPRSIVFGLPLVIGLYMFVIIAYLTVMPFETLANSSAVGVVFGNEVYGVMHWIMPVLVAASSFGAANGCAFTGGRLIFASARNKHMPEILAMLHKERNSPIPALIFSYIIALIMILPESSNFGTLITYFNFVAWVTYGVTFGSLLWLRYKRPDLKRPYKVFIGIPVVMVFCSLYLVIAPFASAPLESFFCLLFILSGIPFYFAFVKYQIIPDKWLKKYDQLTQKIQKYLNVAMPASAEDICS
eukprot:TCONS_00064646-protein